MHNTKSNSGAARFLHISFNTYAKYAKIYGLFEQHKNPSGTGIPKGGAVKKVSFEDIFANKNVNYNLQHLKNRLINEMIFEEKCAVCGYDERRVFDDKVGLLLDFIDGNHKNMAKENMRLICFNCRFNIRGKLSQSVLKRIDAEYNENMTKDKEDVVKVIWDDLNPRKDEMPVIQTNSNDVEDIWKKYNQ
jgi:hypothetical protein